MTRKRDMLKQVEYVEKLILDIAMELPMNQQNQKNLIREVMGRFVIDRRYAKEVVEITESRLLTLNRIPEIQLTDQELKLRRQRASDSAVPEPIISECEA